MNKLFGVKPLNEISITDRIMNNGYFAHPGQGLYRARTHRRTDSGEIEKITSLYNTGSRGGDYVEFEYQKGNEPSKYYSGYTHMGFGIEPEKLETWEEQMQRDKELYANAPKKEKNMMMERWNKRRELFNAPSIGLSNFGNDDEEFSGRTPIGNVNPAVRKRVTGSYQPGGVIAEIRPDNRSWVRREIIDPAVTWVRTRPGYQPARQVADLATDFIPGVGEVKDVARGNYLAALIGVVPGVGDVVAKMAKSPIAKKITVLPEGKSFLTEKQAKRINKAAQDRINNTRRKPL